MESIVKMWKSKQIQRFFKNCESEGNLKWIKSNKYAIN